MAVTISTTRDRALAQLLQPSKTQQRSSARLFLRVASARTHGLWPPTTTGTSYYDHNESGNLPFTLYKTHRAYNIRGDAIISLPQVVLALHHGSV